MTKALISALLLAATVAGCSTSSGAHEAGPVPTAPVSQPPASTGQATSTTTSTATTSTKTTTAAASAPVPLCSDKAVAIKVAAQQGAAGTISTTWRARNTSGSPCRSYGYPGMDFHTASGWLDVRVHRGGFANINGTPTRVVLAPNQSLYFVSYWNDVDTDQGPCKRFDRVKVTLPDNFVPARIAASGCLNPKSVDVGPVSATRPA